MNRPAEPCADPTQYTPALLKAYIGARCPKAFAGIVQHYGKRLSAFLHQRISRHFSFTAEDVAQETWIRAWTSPPKVVLDNDLWPWLMVVSCNRLRTMCAAERALKRMPRGGVMSLPEEERIASSTQDPPLAQYGIFDMIERLRPHLRAIIAFRMEGTLMVDYARLHGLSKRTVERWLREAQDQLRELMVDARS